MRLFFAIVLCCAHFTAPSQHVLDIRDLHLDLRHMALAVDTVMLGFRPEASVGTSHVGIGPGPDDVRFETTTDVALHQLIARSLPDTNDPMHVAVKVNTLRMEEVRNSRTAIGSCAVHIEFLQRKDDGWYRIHEQGTHLTDTDMDDPHGQEAVLIASLEDLFRGFWNARTRGTLTDTPTIPTATRTPVAEFKLPIAQDAAPRRGLYRSFHDFRMNAPDSVPAFSIAPLRTANGNPKRARLTIADGTDPGTLWGFSDGARYYANAGRYFIELFRDGERFTTVLPNPQADHDQAAFVPTGSLFVFGPLGAMLVSGMAGGMVPFGTGAMNTVENLDMRLDLLTGRLGMTGIAVPKVGTSRHYFVYSDKSAAETQVCIEANDGLIVCLRPGQFHEFTPEMRPEPIALGLRTATGQQHVLMLDTYRTDDQLFLIKVKKDGSLSVTEPGSQMRVPIIDGLKETDRALPRQ